MIDLFRPLDHCSSSGRRRMWRVCAGLAGWLVCAGLAWHGMAAEPAHRASPELQPYRVRVEIAQNAPPDFSASSRQQFLRALANALERSPGSLWQVVVTADQSARPAGLQPLERVLPAALAARATAENVDKLYLLSVESEGGRYRVAGREWDHSTAQLSPVRVRELAERRALVSAAQELLRDLFRPVGTIEQVKGGPVTLRLWGRGLVDPQADWTPTAAGSLFEAYYRYLNKDRQVERIQQVPWTYLALEESEEGATSVTVTSGLRTAFSGRRRRIESVALGVAQPLAETRLTLITRPPGRRPLAGVEVEVSSAAHPPRNDAETSTVQPPLLRLVTDRQGQVRLPTAIGESHQPVWLFVRSGQNLMARVPFVPGIRADETLELSDDQLRLDVEGQVAQLQSELIDAVARRAVLAAQARLRAKARDWPRVEQCQQQLAAMPAEKSFAADLNAIRINGLERARAQKDRLTELRIRKLCDETQELIAGYLGPDKMSELQEELAELKKIAEEDAAAEKELGEGAKKPAGEAKKKRTGSQRKPAAERKQVPEKQPAF
ncbi:MAG: hypothetical protein ACKV0T_00990 [Planctomycetales bacterium]